MSHITITQLQSMINQPVIVATCNNQIKIRGKLQYDPKRYVYYVDGPIEHTILYAQDIFTNRGRLWFQHGDTVTFKNEIIWLKNE